MGDDGNTSREPFKFLLLVIQTKRDTYKNNSSFMLALQIY